MSRENEPGDSLFDEINAFLSGESSEKPTHTDEEIPAHILGFYPIAPKDHTTLSQLQGGIDKQIAAITPFNEPDKVEVDTGMPTLKRATIDEPLTMPFIYQDGNYIQQAHANTRYVEYIHYTHPEANSLSQLLDMPIEHTLRLDLHHDIGTYRQAWEVFEKEGPTEFRPETTYALHPQEASMLKVVKLPHNFDDSRSDLFPEDPSGQFVFSAITPADVAVMKGFLELLSKRF